MIWKSLSFWTLVAALLGFVLRFVFPTFPLEAADILALFLFLLGLIGVVPQYRAVHSLTGSIVNSLAFWQLVAGLFLFVVRFFAPEFPFDQAIVVSVIVFVLSYFNINPELRIRGLIE